MAGEKGYITTMVKYLITTREDVTDRHRFFATIIEDLSEETTGEITTVAQMLKQEGWQ